MTDISFQGRLGRLAATRHDAAPGRSPWNPSVAMPRPGTLASSLSWAAVLWLVTLAAKAHLLVILGATSYNAFLLDLGTRGPAGRVLSSLFEDGPATQWMAEFLRRLPG